MDIKNEFLDALNQYREENNMLTNVKPGKAEDDRIAVLEEKITNLQHTIQPDQLEALVLNVLQKVILKMD